MKILKDLKTIQVKLQGRENKENVSRTITIVDSTEEEVTEFIKDTIKVIGCNPFEKPLAIHIKVGDTSFTIYNQETPSSLKRILENKIELGTENFKPQK